MSPGSAHSYCVHNLLVVPLRSEEDNELEREGVSEVEGGSGSKESVTDGI